MKGRALITGADGFIGKNLTIRLNEEGYEIVKFTRNDTELDLKRALNSVEVVFHLAGENRPKDSSQFERVNVELTASLCKLAKMLSEPVPIIFTSSTQAKFDNPYGSSKLKAERILKDYANDTGANVTVLRLPGVFGKWCKPDYNSVVATFCHKIARDEPINIDDAAVKLGLVYIDDVVNQLIELNRKKISGFHVPVITDVYEIEVGELASIIESFHKNRRSLLVESVGAGIMRALYATYLSFVPPSQFSYKIDEKRDSRGVFVEFLKTRDSGQVSFLTVNPGEVRGGHYHHSKNERFLVVCGELIFRFKNIISGETHTIESSGNSPKVVASVPGWAHDLKNVGSTEAIVILWASEVLDPQKQDTIMHKAV
ncbi:NAD-dependent epimerase/dehydratase family protein [bacterium]|nr:NAD-dependent epimerase/dehydratase family protein [bacterium]